MGSTRMMHSEALSEELLHLLGSRLVHLMRIVGRDR